MAVYIEIDDEHDIKVIPEEDDILIEINGQASIIPKDVARSLAFVIIGMTDGFREKERGRDSGSTKEKQISR